MGTQPKNDLVAVIDLGSNSCLLLIARQTGHGLEPVKEVLRVVRLGAGVDESGLLSQLAMDRSEAVFSEYRQIIEQHGCTRVRCVATSAFRDAANRDELRQRLLETVGYDLRALDGDEEASLVMKAVLDAFPAQVDSRWIVDVGGGSTEIVVERGGEMTATVSMGLGSVRHTERWLRSDPPEMEELLVMHADILAQLLDIEEFEPPRQMVGVGGTATTFVALEKHLDTYNHQQVHGSQLSGESLQISLDRCLAANLEERRTFAGLHPDRAEIIIAGGSILLAVLEKAGLDQMTVSDRGLRWGVAAEMAG
ncbi:MAG: Ppx/GppA family phosphatase [Candidatus Marinimicrobia bacterium]|nr:Ppx/GppA family phosphatase [Candidatus Neomarinimicrobiota bacterium]